MNLHNNKLAASRWRAISAGPGVRSLLVSGGLLIALTLALATVAVAQTPGSRPGGGNEVDYGAQALRVNIWHDKDNEDVYRRGEPVRVYFEANADAYAVVYQINTAGKVSILWPLSRYDDGFVFGSHLYQLPVQGSPQILTGSEEGVGYVEAIVSSYPFDLRILELDFYHETGDEQYEFFAAGDPFLAMNEVNYSVTGLEDASDYVVTNYTSYYVHRQVDHPRYLCHQCHDYGQYRPYADSCSLNINYDYGWYNSWWVGFGYYPLYTYPAYYYVDPWSWRPWVNYWYTPVYAWPSYPCYTWSSTCYNWRYSPIYRGDVHERYRDGNRRYRPLTRDVAANGRMRDGYYERENLMVRNDRPSRDMDNAIRTRTPRGNGNDVAARDTGTGRTGRTKVNDRNASPDLAGAGGGAAGSVRNDGRYVNTKPVSRDRVTFREDRSVRGAPGLRVPEGSSRDSVQRPAVRDRSQRTAQQNRAGHDLSRTATRGTRESGSQAPTRLGPRDRGQSRSSERTAVTGKTERARIKPQTSDRSSRRTIRSVEPRKGNSRIWTGGRNSAAKDRTARPQQYRSGGTKSRSDTGNSGSSRVKSRSRDGNKNSGNSSGRSGSVKKPSSRNKSSARSPSVKKSSSGGKKSSSGSRTRSAPSRKSGGSRSGGSRQR